MGVSGLPFLCLTHKKDMSSELLKNAQLAMDKAKISFFRRIDLVFFANVCFSLKHSFDEKVMTAETDGFSVKYNPEYFLKLSPDERVFLMLHETMHVAYLHVDPMRIINRDPKKWNIAADHVINLQLIDRGLTLPPGGFADKSYAGKSVEQVYALLPANVKMPKDQQDLAPGQGKPGDDPGKAQAISTAMSEKAQEVLVRAATIAKMADASSGSIPGDLEMLLDKLLNPKLPWQTILRKWLTSFSKNDYSLRKPNRRHFPQFHLPSLWSESLGDFAMFMDTSGSVSEEDGIKCLTETHNILKVMKPKAVHFGQFDTNIKSVECITTAAELMKIKIVGRGGTQIEPVLDWAEKNKPQFIVIFTDGYFHMPEIATNVPILWLIYDNPEFTAPKGRVIHYDKS